MLTACKVLKLDIEDFEPKTFDEFFRKHHDESVKVPFVKLQTNKSFSPMNNRLNSSLATIRS
jgi:hypothetical protein